MRRVGGLAAIFWLACASFCLCSAQLAGVVTHEQLRALAAVAGEKLQRSVEPRAVRYASEVAIAAGAACGSACSALEQVRRERSEESRAGKEWVERVRLRGSPYT